MLRKYSGIISIIAIVVAVLLVIGGIATAITIESFLPVLYYGIGAAIFYLFMHSYAIMLETTANSDNHYKSWMYSILPNSCPHIM